MTETEEPHDRSKEQHSTRPRPTRRVQFTLTQSSNQLVLLMSRTHAHIKTQLNKKDGLKAYGNKGDKTILNEARHYTLGRQLCHETRWMYNERKKPVDE